MEGFSCPRCGTEMNERVLGQVTVNQCPDGHGVFLDRADLGGLIESETDWHRDSGAHTQPLPRITADMSVPPAMPPQAQAWVETLFT